MTPRFRHGQLHVLFGRDPLVLIRISTTWQSKHALSGQSAGMVALAHGPTIFGSAEYHAVIVGTPTAFEATTGLGLLFLCRPERKPSKTQARLDLAAWRATVGSLPIAGAGKRRWVAMACCPAEPNPLVWRIWPGKPAGAVPARSGAN